MKNQKLIDSTFEEFRESGEWYLISNLTFEIQDQKEMQYLFDKAEQSYAKNSLIPDFIDMLIWASSNKVEISSKVLSSLEELTRTVIENGSEDINSYVLLNLATVYHQLSHADKVKEWVTASLDAAVSADDYCQVIEFVSHPHTGLHIADKVWGNELLGLVKSKVDDKTFKKIEKSTSSLLS